MRGLDAPCCAAAGHGEEDLNTAERGLSTTSTHSQAPEIPLSHDPSPTKGAAAAGPDPSGAGPRPPTAPFEANVAAVNQASQAGAQQLAPSPALHKAGISSQPWCTHWRVTLVSLSSTLSGHAICLACLPAMLPSG